MGFIKSKIFSTFLIFFIGFTSFSQDQQEGVDHKDRGGKKGAKEVELSGLTKIELFKFKEGDIEFNIKIEFDSKGIPVSRMPSVVGLNWNLMAGGQIKKSVYHLPDEYSEEDPTRWGDYNPERYQGYLGNFADNPASSLLNRLYEYQSSITGYRYSTFIDSGSDLYNMSMSNGDNVSFYFDRDETGSYPNNVNIIQNKFNYNITPFLSSINSSSDTTNIDFEILNNNGIKYKFKKGPKNYMPHNEQVLLSNGSGLASDYYLPITRDYYVSKIESEKSNNLVEFDYEKIELNEYYFSSSATMKNYGPDNYERLRGYSESIITNNVSYNSPKKITSNNYKMIFEYKETNYKKIIESDCSYEENVLPEKIFQNFKLLDKVKLYTAEGVLIKGYVFIYDDSNNFNLPQLAKIKRIDKNGSLIDFKSFDYYRNDDNLQFFDHTKRHLYGDGFGYLNYKYGLNDIGCLDLYIKRNMTSKKFFFHYGDRNVQVLDKYNFQPSLKSLKEGMLKNINDDLMGSNINVDYQMNELDGKYYGGLLIKSIKKKHKAQTIDHTKIQYKDPFGYGYDLNRHFFEVLNGSQFFDNSDYNRNSFDRIYGNRVNLLKIHPLSFTSSTYDLLYSNADFRNFFVNGVNYQKVIYKKLSTSDSLVNNGSVVKNYKPINSFSGIVPLIKKTEYRDVNNILLKVKEFYYDTQNFYNLTRKYWESHVKFTESSPPCHNIQDRDEYYQCLENYAYYDVLDPIHSNINVKGDKFLLKEFTTKLFSYALIEKNEKDFFGQDSIVKRTEYEYKLNNQNINLNNKPVKIKRYFNDRVYIKLIKYLSDLNQIPNDLVSLKNKYNPIFQVSNWVSDTNMNNLTFISSNIFDLNSDGKLNKSYSSEDKYLLSSLDHDQLHGTYTNGILQTNLKLNTELLYDDNERLFSKIDHKQKLNELFIYDHNSRLISNLISSNQIITYQQYFSNNLFGYVNFENQPTNNSVVQADTPFGEYVFQGNTYEISVPNNSHISYWYFKNNKWRKKVIENVNSNSYIINLSTNNYQYIDQIKYYSKDLNILSFKTNSYDDSNRLLHSNQTPYDHESFYYDNLDRVIYTKNIHGELIESFEYNTLN